MARASAPAKTDKLVILAVLCADGEDAKAKYAGGG